MTKHVCINIILAFFCVLTTQVASAQSDTLKPRIRVDSLPLIDSPVVAKKALVDSVMRFHSPKKAAIRSALLPGLGQIYNKRYWKLPIIYGALGITAGIFIYNIDYYNKLKFAVAAKASGDTNQINQIDPLFRPLDNGALIQYRNEFRANIDYSVLFFILFWGLNVVDAAVDAHLKAFDVSPDLSLHFKFGPSQMARTSGVSLILAFK